MTLPIYCSQRRWIIGTVAGVASFFGLASIVIGAFPFDFFKDSIRRQVEGRLGTRVSLAAIERREIFSFHPTLRIREIAVSQPAWAEKGEMLQAESIEMRLPLLPLLVGKGLQPESIVAHGLVLRLIRDAQGRANWEGPGSSADKGAQETGLGKLIISDGRISLHDEKRRLTLSGELHANERELLIDAKGRFHDAPAHLLVRGDPVFDLSSYAPYAATMNLNSSLLKLQARANMRGALNLKAMTLDVHAAAPSLKYLDDIIEAGLFGTRPIDLTAKVRHDQRDWFIDSMKGNIGRSPLVAKAAVLKRAGRTKIDAEVHFTRFAFEDLSDTRGAALAAAEEARIGKRILPGTRINISKVGPTDGVVRFKADQLLLQRSAFRSLSGVINLDGKLLTINDIRAGMSNGQMTGNVRIDQRNGVARPRLSVDLAFTDGRLETLIGAQGATGPLRGRVMLSGDGDTIRAALARADGRAGLVVEGGTVKRTIAAVLGQDLGKAIGAALRDRQQDVPLRCLALGFVAKGGMLTADPFFVDTDISVGEGQGQLSLATEAVALAMKGQSRNPSMLRLADPIRIGGTFSDPKLSAAGTPPGSKLNAGGVIHAVGKSLGHALGVRDDKPKKPVRPPVSISCSTLARKIL